MLLSVGLGVGCASSPTPNEPRPDDASPAITASPLGATLPSEGAPDLAPAQLRVAPRGQGDGTRLADVDGCAECHTDAFAGWKASAHSFASFDDPVYRVAVERLRAERGKQASRMCAACHDIALLVDGAMDREVRPEDPRAHAGVSCRVCHGITAVRADGNGSFDLDPSPVPVPREGDPASARAHREAVARPVLREGELCLGCHRSFLDTATGNAHHLPGQDEAGAWRRSAYAGSHAARVDEVPERDCRSCHMPRVPAVAGDPGAKRGTLASHAFLGGHTWLADAQRDPELRAIVADFLKQSATIDIAGVTRASGEQVFVTGEPIAILPGERLVVDVVVKNERVGHRFPGGVLDAQDTWLEIVVTDARGVLTHEAGTRHAATGEDPTAHRLFAHVAGSHGQALRQRETHDFRALVYDNTLAPRDAAIVRYGLTVPEGASLPLTVRATLRHRSRSLPLQRAACADAITPRGRAFAAESPKNRARAFDPCPPQPVTTLGAAWVALGGGAIASRAPLRAEHARALAWAQGLSHALQEHLDLGRYPLALAIGRAQTEPERAAAVALLADLEAKQGRREAAFGAARRAEELVGPHPALARVRAEALRADWAWAEAATHLEQTAKLAPQDDTVWATLAVMLGGAGAHARALEAAAHGLTLQPRDGDLLRVQSLALDALGAEPALSARARDSFLARRTPDDAPSVRARCSANVPRCAQERDPLHVNELRPAAR
ncbi:MAG: hypothetical protein IPQ09_17765 [Myxococcales bacterium]|nr:hypothetical protein [Myxococcales bacterium]HQY61927.1 multiheme c-type cytochrome [Polyangiaceae bacterium]